MLLTLLTAAVLGAGPLDTLDSAATVWKGLDPDRQKSVIFLSFLGADDIDELRYALEDALNHATRRIKTQRIQKVGGIKRELWFFDTADLGWKYDGVLRLIERERYFKNSFEEKHKGVYIYRADQLLREISAGNTYYDLTFDNPKTLNDIFKVLGFDAKSKAVDEFSHGARVTKSRVSRSGYRVVANLGNSVAGEVWITDDINYEQGKRPGEFIREKIDERRFQKPDAHEVIGFLPNGLLWFAIADGNDVLAELVPDKIAIDTRDYRPADQLQDISNERPHRLDTTIANPYDCRTCHALGFQPAPDYVSAAIDAQPKKLDPSGFDKRNQNRIEDFYSTARQSESIATGSKRYSEAFSKLYAPLNRTALAAQTSFALIRSKVEDDDVTLAQAAAEIDITVEDFPRFAKAVEAKSTDQPGYKLRINLANWLLNEGRKEAAQAVLGYNADEFRDFLGGKVVLPLGSNSINALASGDHLSRLEWETAVYIEAALLFCYEKRGLTAATAEMVREKFQQPDAKIDYAEPQLRIEYGPSNSRANGGADWQRQRHRQWFQDRHGRRSLWEHDGREWRLAQ